MRTVSAACAMADALSTAAAVIVARMWRRVIFIVTFPFAFLDLVWSSSDRSDGVATPGSNGSCELDETHGREEMLRKGCNGRVGVAFEHGAHDRGVFGLDIAGFFGVAPDREPSIALALLVQHIAEAEQPLRAAGIHQCPMEDSVPYHPFLIVMGRIVEIGVRNGAERRERSLHRCKPCGVAALD